MTTCLFLLACVTAVVNLFGGLILLLGNRKIGDLAAVPPADDAGLPSLSILVPARNEQRHIKEALESLCRQDYPDLEIIAVDDRSTDRTYELMQQVARGQPRLRIEQVGQLPSGWLGKNHALWLAASQAKGELLLFTDADVVMQSSVLRRAVHYARQNDIDHLAILPQIVMPNWLLEAFALNFGLYFNCYVLPWRATNPRSRCHVGIGAFNLLSAEVYAAIGTHQAIAMRPDDDLKLGKLVKKHGFRQEMMYGGSTMHVPWYASLREVVVGLEKNAFSGVDYRVSMIGASSLIALTMHAWPFAALLLTEGATWWLNLAIVVGLLGLCVATALRARFRPWCAVLFPVTVLVFVYIQWRATILAFYHNGIRWRDTLYPLAELKANRVEW